MPTRPWLRPLELGLEFLGRKIDPVEVAGNPAVGRHDDHARGMGIELGLRVVRVSKPDRPGQGLDRRLFARQEVPARFVPGRS